MKRIWVFFDDFERGILSVLVLLPINELMQYLVGARWTTSFLVVWMVVAAFFWWRKSSHSAESHVPVTDQPDEKILSAGRFDHLVSHTAAYDSTRLAAIRILEQMRSGQCTVFDDISITALEMENIDACDLAYGELIKALKDKTISSQDLAALKVLLN